MDFEDGGPLKATTNSDVAIGPTQFKWKLCLGKDGGTLKMEVHELKSLHHNNGETIKLIRL